MKNKTVLSAVFAISIIAISGCDNNKIRGNHDLTEESRQIVLFENIVKFFRLALGVSYKLTDGVNLQYKYFDDNNIAQVINIDKKAIDGLVATLTFKFGKF